MADETDKVEEAPESLTDAEQANFGGQPQGEEPAGYVANFEGDEINGHHYKLGETIKSDVDAGTIAYLVQNGRITPFTGDSAKSPSGDDSGTAAGPGTIKDGEQSNDAFADLDDEQTAEAQKLVNGNSKDELLKLAEDEDVEDVTADNNKSEIAAKIVAARSSDSE